MTIAKAHPRLPVIGNLLSVIIERDVYFEKLRRLGAIVELRLGAKPYYLVNEPSAIHQLLAGDSKAFDKGHLVDMMRPFFGNGVATCPYAEHREQRRMLQPAFERTAIARYIERAVPAATRPLLSYRDGHVVDVPTEMNRIALGIMSRFTVSAESHAIESEVHRSLLVFVEGLIPRTVMPQWVTKLPLQMNRRWSQAADDLRNAVHRAIRAYRASGVDREDMLSMLLATKRDNGSSLTDQEICDQIINMLAAGSETSATTMAWFFHALSTNPAIEAEILEEIDAVCRGRQPTADDVPQLTRLNNTITEVLRLYHPFWILGRRSAEPVTIAGEAFPSGTEFLFCISGLQRDPGLFPDPLAFRPSRWETSTAPRHAFIPYSSGVRKCMGDNFANLEMALVFATILQRCRLVAFNGHQVKRVARAAVQPDLLQLRVQVRPGAPSSLTKPVSGDASAAASEGAPPT